MSHGHACVHCTSQGAEAEQQPVHEPIQLPGKPTPIRVHKPDTRPMDCTLHPDGTLTAVLAGQLCRNFMTFADMLETNWAHARIEWNPAPLPDDEPELGAVQEAFPAT